MQWEVRVALLHCASHHTPSVSADQQDDQFTYTGLNSQSSLSPSPRQQLLPLVGLVEYSEKKATYKGGVFQQEFRLVAAGVELHDVSVPVPEDDLLI